MSILNFLAKTAQYKYYFPHIFTEIWHFLCYLVYLLIAVVSRVLVKFPEDLFKNLCGIGDLYSKTGTESANGWTYGTGSYTTEVGANNGVSNDIVLAFIKDPSVQTTFWSILAFSIVLLLILTLIAIFRSEFTLDPSKAAKGPIIARAFKGLGSFLLVPVVSIGFVYVVNLAVKTVFSLVTTDSQSIVTRIFDLTAGGANRVYLETDNSGGYGEGSFAYYLVHGNNVSELGIGTEACEFIKGSTKDGITASSHEDLLGLLFKGEAVGANYASQGDEKNGHAVIPIGEAVDQLFSFNLELLDYQVKKGNDWEAAVDADILTYISTETVRTVKFNTKPCLDFVTAAENQDGQVKYYVPWQTMIVSLPVNMNNISYAMFKGKLVNFFYDPSEMNLIVGAGTAIILGLNFLGVAIMLLKRALELVILFVISPVVISLYPLDDGNATNNWRKQFRNRLIAPVTVVFVYNIFFMLMGLLDFDKMQFLHVWPGVDWFIKLFYNVLVVCVASKLLTSASKIISDLLGIEDMVGGSAAALKGAVGTVTGAAKTAVTAVAMPGRAIGAARRLGNKMINAGKDFNAGKDDAKAAREDLIQAQKDRDDFVTAETNLKDARVSGDAERIKEAEAAYNEQVKKHGSLAQLNERISKDRSAKNIFNRNAAAWGNASTSLYKGENDRISTSLKKVKDELDSLEGLGDPESNARRKELEAQKRNLESRKAVNEAKHSTSVRRTKHLGFFGLDTSVDAEKFHEKPLREIGQSMVDLLGSTGESTGLSDVIKIATDQKARRKAFSPSSVQADREAKEEKIKKKKADEEYLRMQQEMAEKNRPKNNIAEAKARQTEIAKQRQESYNDYRDATLAKTPALKENLDNAKQALWEAEALDDASPMKNIAIQNAKVDIDKANKAIETATNDLFNRANRVDNNNRFNKDISEADQSAARQIVGDFKSEAAKRAEEDAKNERNAYIADLGEQIKNALASFLQNAPQGNLGGMSGSQMEQFINKLKDPLADAVKRGVITAQKEQVMNTNKFDVKGEMGVLIDQIKSLNSETARKNDDINAILDLLKELEDKINKK